MGQAIVYCTRCNAQLRSTDFEKGSAVKSENQNYCRKCLPEGALPDARERPATEKDLRKRGHGTTSIRMIAPPPKVEEAKKPLLLGIAGAAAGVVVVLLAAVLFSRTDPPRPPPPGPVVDAPKPEPAPPRPLPPLEAGARAAFDRYRKRVAEKPDDIEGQRAHLTDVEDRAPGTSIAPLIVGEREALERRRITRNRREIQELESQASQTTRDQAVILLNAARSRYPEEDWVPAIDLLLSRYTVDPQPAAPAPATPAPTTPRVAATAKPPAPPTFPPGWEKALQSATARDYPAALAALDKSPDADLVKAVAALQADAVRLLGKTPRGQKISLVAIGGRKIEGAFIRDNGGVLEIKEEAGTAEIEIGEVSAASLIDIARGAGSVDPRTAAAFCLIDGDPSVIADLPERFRLYALNVSKAASEPSRDLYRDAVAALQKPATAADGVARLQALLRDRADDLFVRRNRATIATRAQGTRDYVFFAEDLKASGAFRPGKSGKLESCWTCETDVEAAKQKETFLDLEFSTLPDVPYKAWAWVGGCCQEVFDFSCQGTEMEILKTKESAEPGGPAAIVVKPYVPNVKKTHAQHNGPKSPTKWEWAPIPLPRYAKPGVQKLRLFSDQKGFSVTAVVVSATRTNPPADSELRDLLKLRGERPKIAAAPKTTVILAVAIDPSTPHLVGEVREKSLFAIPLFGLLYSGYEPLRSPVTFPERCEYRFTYFVKSPTTLTARIRVNRDGGTLACDVAVPNVVVGKPTEVRIPIGDFKPAFVPGPAIAPGESAHHFHVYAAALDSGLRIDAMTLVEIKN